MEKSGGPGRGNQGADRESPGGLTAESDEIRIAAKDGNVVPYPFQGGDDVEQAPVAGGTVLFIGGPRGQEARRMQAVVHRDDNNAGPGQSRTLIKLQGAAAEEEGAAVNKDENRQLFPCRLVRRPDIEEKAVFHFTGARLRYHGPEGRGVLHAGPGRDRFRRRETTFAARG